MALLTIRTYPDPVLKQKAVEVSHFDEELDTLVENMIQTMYQGNGVGLAATQVGVLKRVIVVDISESRQEPREYINPVIVSAEGSISYEEGCLSIPDYRETVNRPGQVVVRAKDRTGKEFELQAEGLLAVCLQHEIDHLDGILFIDRLSRLKREMFKRWFRKNTAPVQAAS